jgi:hypothetical protein
MKEDEEGDVSGACNGRLVDWAGRGRGRAWMGREEGAAAGRGGMVCGSGRK